MFPCALPPAGRSAPAELTRFVFEVLGTCLEVRSVWSVGHAASAHFVQPSVSYRMLAFADAAALARLRSCARLHRPHIEFLVVVDGDAFVSAWGPGHLSGSLARWAWRQASRYDAWYEESCWDRTLGQAGAVTRVRRKGLLVWEKAD